MMAIQKLKGSSFGENLGWALPSDEEILTLPAEELLSRLKSSYDGLSSDEVKRRLEAFGYNELVRKKKRAAIIDFLSHFKSPLIIILLVAGSISGFFGEIANTIIIFVIVTLSVTLDFYQEFKADRAAEMLKQRVASTATVLRDGAKREVGLAEIVPGDIIFLSAGDIVPADARVISAKDLFVNQSALTGESFPIEKTNLPLKSYDQPVMEWSNYLFMGTSVVSGTATALVVKTGSLTEYGKIAKRLVARGPETEFQRGIRSFGYMIMQVMFLLVIFVFFINALYMRSVLDSLLFAVALAVGLTPELLPMIISVNLSKGAVSMAKKGVIVKRLAAIQNFGSMDVLCADKTGTLTENRIKLVLHMDLIGKESDKVLLYSYLNSYYQTGLKSPLDEAILRFRDIDVKEYSKVDEVPFDFVRKRLSIVVEYQNQRLMITKGAPEEVAKICSSYEVGEVVADITDEVCRKIEEKYVDLSSEGFRVLAVAYKRLREDKPVYTANDEEEMVFLGFIAFLDPPKETAKESLQLLKKAGIELKILTGDNELVTRKVCEDLGLDIRGIITGSEIAQMDNDALARVVEEANVFCRITPAQKDRIINALKNNGHVVGYLGDGINDAPPLKTSDVGISVDNAVDVAKESADIILLQTDLKVLHDGVMEGRKSFGNTMKYIMMGTSSNFGNMFSAAGASLFLPFLPMLPTQILLNNLLYDLSQLAIPADNVDREYIERPKRMDISFIRRFMLIFGPISSIFDFLTFFLLILIFNATESMFQTAWFIESLYTQTLVIFVIRTRKTPFYRSRPSRILIFSTLGVLGFALIVPFTPLGPLFKFVELPPLFFAFLAACVATYLILVEVVKGWFYRRHFGLLEQISMPRREAGPHLSKTAILIQDMVAVICLRPEDEITIDSLLDDLKMSARYPIEPNQIVQGLNYLRRAGLISVNWHGGTIHRQKAMGDYVAKYVRNGPLWRMVANDWWTIGSSIQAKYKKINPEFENLIEQR